MAYGFNDDKTKVEMYPASELYNKSEVDAEISDVNDRIDNILTSPAPTEQEIIDARRGADGVNYPTLGGAIRGQVTDLKSKSNNLLDVLASDDDINLMSKIDVLISRVWSGSGGTISQSASINTRACSSNLLTFGDCVVDIVLNGYDVAIMKVDTDMQTVLNDSGWITGSTGYIFEEGYYYSFNFRTSSNSAIPSPLDVKNHIDILTEPIFAKDNLYYGTLVFADDLRVIKKLNVVSSYVCQGGSGQLNIANDYNRACTPFLFQLGDVTATIIANGYQVGILKIDTDRITVLSDSGWLSNNDVYNFENNFFYVMNFKKDSGTTITSSKEVENNVDLAIEPFYKNFGSEITNLNNSVSEIVEGENISIKNRLDLVYGYSWANDNGSVIRNASYIRVSTRTPINFGNINAVLKPKNGYSVGIIVLESDQTTIVEDTGWISTKEGFAFKKQYYYVFNFKNPNGDNTITVESVEQNFDFEALALTSQTDSIINSIDIEYGRINGETSYYLLRIPKTDIKGRTITPKVALTSADGTVAGTKVSALTYAKREEAAVVINASLFNTGTMKPEGQLVIDGVDMTTYKTNPDTGDQYAWMDSDMGSPISDKECYPLLIDANGNLSCYASENRKAGENQPTAIIAAGYKYAVTAWGMIVNNFTDDDLQHDEIVHSGKYIRQAIGQYQNGDYFVFSCDKDGYSGINAPASHEAGITYSDLASFLINKGVKFAYSLDGGGSCETVIGNRQVNPIFVGNVGRAVPTVIYWSAD